MRKFFAILLLSLPLVGFSTPEFTCQEGISKKSKLTLPTETDTTGAKQFWDTLQKHCGKTFEGKIINAPAGDDFYGKRLVMHVLSCTDTEILIPFNVGEDKSRTWILRYINGKISLKHDHRHKDGTPDAITMYGGITPNSGLPTLAVFPADEETAAMIPTAANNVWWITLDETSFTYNLRRIGTERFFSVSFDLTNEIVPPKPSWGWEDYPSKTKER